MRCLWLTLADPTPAHNGQFLYSGGLIDLTLGQALLFKEGIAYALTVLGAFNLVSVPLILVVMKEQTSALSSAARASKE